MALTCFVVAALLVLTAGLIRAHSTLTASAGVDIVLPRWTLFVFAVLAAVSLALLHTAGLHLTPWLRAATPVLVVVLLLGTVYLPRDLAPVAAYATWVGAALLVVLSMVRWRGSFAWWESPVSLAVIGVSQAIAYRSQGGYAGGFGTDAGPNVLVLAFQSLSVLGVAFVVVSGAAFAQLALLLATRLGAVVDRSVRPRSALVAVIALVAVVDVVLAVRRALAPAPLVGSGRSAVYLASLLLLAAVVVPASWLVARSGRDHAGLAELESGLAVVAIPAALAIAGISILQLMIARVDSSLVYSLDLSSRPLSGLEQALSSGSALVIARLVAGAGLVAWAVWTARRRRRPVPAAIAAGVGMTLILVWLRRATSGVISLPWTSEAVIDLASLAALVALAVLAARGRLTRGRTVALGVALGIGLAWSVRSTFDAPFVALLGLGATAAVFLGVVWELLTGAAEANDDSGRYPQPARVLFFLAQALLAMSVLAFVAVSGDLTLVNVEGYGALGDNHLGTGVLLAAYALIAVAVLTDRPSASTAA